MALSKKAQFLWHLDIDVKVPVVDGFDLNRKLPVLPSITSARPKPVILLITDKSLLSDFFCASLYPSCDTCMHRYFIIYKNEGFVKYS